MLERLLALLGISRQRDEWLSDDDLKPYGEEGQTSKSSPSEPLWCFVGAQYAWNEGKI